MCAHPFLLGLLGLAIGFKLFRVIRRRHACGGHRHGFYGGPRLHRLMRELKLDLSQRRAVWQVLGDVRRSFMGLRLDKAEAFDALVGALSADDFDRAGLDALADRQNQRITELRAAIVAGLERLHDILTVEQRTRLRELFGIGEPATAGAGPYR
jgi:Spy/CpxP family protein refolding chaperone